MNKKDIHIIEVYELNDLVKENTAKTKYELYNSHLNRSVDINYMCSELDSDISLEDIDNLDVVEEDVIIIDANKNDENNKNELNDNYTNLTTDISNNDKFIDEIIGINSNFRRTNHDYT